VNRKRKRTGSFQAVDQLGRSHTVHIDTEYLDAGDGEWVEGIKYLSLSDGTSLNRTAQGEYQTVSGQLNLKSADPAAP
jgi:hypothetical protein